MTKPNNSNNAPISLAPWEDLLDASSSTLRVAAKWIRRHEGKCFVVFLDIFAEESEKNQEILRTIFADLLVLHRLRIKLIIVPVYQWDELHLLDSSVPIMTDVASSLANEAEAASAIGMSTIALNDAMLRNLKMALVNDLEVEAPLISEFHPLLRIKRQAVEGKALNVALAAGIDQAALSIASEMGIAWVSPWGFWGSQMCILDSTDVCQNIISETIPDKLIIITNPSDKTVQPLTRTEFTPDQIIEHDAPWVQLAARAIDLGVPKVHLVGSKPGYLLAEIYSNEGAGGLVIPQSWNFQLAEPEKLPGICALLRPMEENGSLVERTLEQLQADIENEYFFTAEFEGAVTGCFALLPIDQQSAELAAVCIHPQYQRAGHGSRLLEEAEQVAKTKGFEQLIVLTTVAAEWFKSHGFVLKSPSSLPKERANLYNLTRQSFVLSKRIAKPT